ncbi:MAG: STAS domain-containing protein [Alphaproteobacteria bacterium]|nr:STAS domain-containing protein [Alphaproteobacteria bacterium]
MAMEYTVKELDNDKEIIVTGDITFKDHSRFFEVINLIKAAKNGRVWLNFGGVEFIDSAALGMLVIANEEGADNDVEVIIKNAGGKVRSTMELASFDKLFNFEN